MGVLLFILITSLGLFLSKFSWVITKNSYVGFFLAFLFSFILSGFVTYTPDWEGYETWIKFGTGRDLFFYYLTYKFPDIEYRQLHLTFTGIYSFFLAYFINKFSKHQLLILIIFLPTIYIFQTTQIRYFLGFYSMCLAFYFWFIDKKKAAAIIFLVFAIANHLSLLIILPLLYFFKYNINILHKKVFRGFVIISLGYYFVFKLILLIIPKSLPFINYLISEKQDSSFLGGLFSFLPALIGILFIYKYSTNKLKHHKKLSYDRKFQLLYQLSIIPFIFFGIALNRQIIGQRFIFPALLFQLLLIFYIGNNYNTKKQNFNLTGISMIYFIFYYAYIYVVTPLFIGSNITEEISLILNSNSLIGRWF